MGDILTITLPVFALIAMGYGAVWRGFFKQSDMRVLGQFVLQIALPALLFRAVATKPLTEVLVPSYLSVFLAAGLAIIALTYGGAALAGVGPRRRAVAALGSTIPNSGFIGYPMMLLLFPDLAGVILAMNMLVENFILIPLCLMLAELGRRDAGRPLGQMLGAMAMSVLKRPMVLSLLVGLVWTLLSLPIPRPAMRVLDVTANAAAALSLFAIGGSLFGLPTKGNRALAGFVALGKLVLHPALAFACLVAFAAIGWAVPTGDLATAVVLSAAMPMFGIYTILAQDYELEGLASLALLMAMVGAFFTLSALLAWMV